MTSRRKSNIPSNYPSDTESLNAKELIYAIRKHSQHSHFSQHSQTHPKLLDDNLQILENKIKKHSLQTTTPILDKDVFDHNGLWSISNPQLENNNQQIDLLTNRTSDDDDLDKHEQFLLAKGEQIKLNASDLEHRSNQYLNKRLPWYCESSSPIKWFKEYSNDQLPKVNYNQKLIDQQLHQKIKQNHHQQQLHQQQLHLQQPQQHKSDHQLINLDPNEFSNLEYNNNLINNNFDNNSVQTYTKNYSIKEPKHVKTSITKDHLRFVNQQQPHLHSHRPSQIDHHDPSRYRGSNQSSIGNSKPQSTQNHFQPFHYNYQDYSKQWRKLSLPHHFNSHSHLHPNQKFLGSSRSYRSSFGGRRSYSNKNKFKFNPFSNIYKPRSTNFSGLNEMFADSSVPGVREICHSDGYFRKFIWVIAFFLFSFLALNDIQQLLSDFYSYPISVDMRMRESRKLPFPSITICNLNIVRYSALCNSTLNISMPVELQEKLCGTNLSQMKNTSIEDINDILPDSDQTQTTTKPPFDDYLNYDDEIANEQTNGPETTIHPNRKKGFRPTYKPNIPTKPDNNKLKKKHRLKRSPSSIGGTSGSGSSSSGTGGSGTGSGSGSKSHGQPGTVSNSNANSNLNKASPSPPEFSPEIEMFELTEREEKELQENLTTWLAVMANKNKNLTFSLGHQFDDMLLRCTIKSANCTHPNSFVSSFTPTEGNCYTFVAKTNMNPTHSSSHTTNTFGTTMPVTTSTTTKPPDTTQKTDSTTATSRDSSNNPYTGSTLTDLTKINPPLQNEFSTFSTTEPPDLQTRTTQILNRLDASGGSLGEQASHHQIETILAGADHGLELVINLEKSEYLPGTSQIGALVMVHSPDDFGISASEAIMVSPECATYIGLKMVRISRLPAPYPENCIDVWPKGLQRKSMLNVSYSQQACIKICLQKTIQTRCKCQSAFLEQVELNGTEFRICDTRKRNTRRCVEEVMLRPENKLEDCKCPPRCQVIQYEKTVSVAKWPTREDRVSFDRGTKDINISNVAKVVVYFQTMTLQEVTQQAAWTTAKLFSSLGGFMGMYVGFSFLSLFEVFEILCRRISYSLFRRVPTFKSVANAVLTAIMAKNQIQRNKEKNLA